MCPELATIIESGRGVGVGEGRERESGRGWRAWGGGGGGGEGGGGGGGRGGGGGGGGEKPSPVRKMVSDRKRASSRRFSGPPSRRYPRASVATRAGTVDSAISS